MLWGAKLLHMLLGRSWPQHKIITYATGALGTDKRDRWHHRHRHSVAGGASEHAVVQSAPQTLFSVTTHGRLYAALGDIVGSHRDQYWDQFCLLLWK